MVVCWGPGWVNLNFNICYACLENNFLLNFIIKPNDRAMNVIIEYLCIFVNCLRTIPLIGCSVNLLLLIIQQSRSRNSGSGFVGLPKMMTTVVQWISNKFLYIKKIGHFLTTR